MMLEDGDDVFRARLTEENSPGMSIKVLRLEHWNEILIAKLCQRAIRSNLVLVLVAARLIHVARIPLVSVGGYRERRPVNEDAELGILEPIGDFVLRQRFPIRAIG